MTAPATHEPGPVGGTPVGRTTGAGRQLQDAGFVVLRGALAAGTVEALSAAFHQHLDDLLRRVDAARAGVDQGIGHHRLACLLPWRAPFAADEVLTPPAVADVLGPALGPDARIVLYTSNVSLPGSAAQPVHRDDAALFPAAAVTHPPIKVTLNIPLCDIDDANGPTEVWPSTHHIPDGLDDDHRQLDDRAAVLPPVRLTMDVGDVCLRDNRLWHRGTPNRSSRPRVQLAVVFARPWVGHPALPVHHATWHGWRPRLQRLTRHRTIVPDHPDHPDHPDDGAGLVLEPG